MSHSRQSDPRRGRDPLRLHTRASHKPARTTDRLYDRRTELPRILPLWPQELDDTSPQARRVIVSKLRCALRAERRRGVAGHWTYDLARHVELLRVYQLELVACGMRDVRERRPTEPRDK